MTSVSAGQGWRWAWEDLNLRPHPYQVSRAKRCADQRFPRSLATVRGEGMRSNSPPGSAHRRTAVAADTVCHQPVADKAMGLPGERGSAIGGDPGFVECLLCKQKTAGSSPAISTSTGQSPQHGRQGDLRGALHQACRPRTALDHTLTWWSTWRSVPGEQSRLAPRQVTLALLAVPDAAHPAGLLAPKPNRTGRSWPPTGRRQRPSAPCTSTPPR
jgi:hypothetical protein